MEEKSVCWPQSTESMVWYLCSYIHVNVLGGIAHEDWEFFQGGFKCLLACHNIFSSLVPCGSRRWVNGCYFSVITQANDQEYTLGGNCLNLRLNCPFWLQHLKLVITLSTYKFIQFAIGLVTIIPYSVTLIYMKQNRSYSPVRFHL